MSLSCAKNSPASFFFPGSTSISSFGAYFWPVLGFSRGNGLNAMGSFLWIFSSHVNAWAVEAAPVAASRVSAKPTVRIFLILLHHFQRLLLKGAIHRFAPPELHESKPRVIHLGEIGIGQCGEQRKLSQGGDATSRLHTVDSRVFSVFKYSATNAAFVMLASPVKLV